MSELQEKRKYYLDRSLKAVYFIDENGQKQGTYTEYERNSSKVIRKIEYKDGKVWNGKVDTGKVYIAHRNGEKIEEKTSKRYYYLSGIFIPATRKRDLPFVDCKETKKIENGEIIKKTKEFYYETSGVTNESLISPEYNPYQPRFAHRIEYQTSYENGVVDKIERYLDGKFMWSFTFKDGKLTEYSDRNGYHASFENGKPVGDYKMPLNTGRLCFYYHRCAIKTGENLIDNIDNISMPIMDGDKIFKFSNHKFSDYFARDIIVEGTWNDGKFTGEAKNNSIDSYFSAKWENGNVTGRFFKHRDGFILDSMGYDCNWHDGVCDVKRHVSTKHTALSDVSYSEEYTLKEGKLHGVKRKYNKKGWLESEIQYENGKRRNKILYRSDGTVFYRSLNEVLKNVRKKIASKRIAKEKELATKTDKNTILQKSKETNLVDMAKETVGLSK